MQASSVLKSTSKGLQVKCWTKAWAEKASKFRTKTNQDVLFSLNFIFIDFLLHFFDFQNICHY